MMLDLDALRRALARTRIIATAADYQQLLCHLMEQMRTECITLDFINQHAGNLLMGNAEFRSALMNMDIVLRDGIGVQLALRLQGRDAGLNMNGTDFIPALIAYFSQSYPQAPMVFFGTAEPWLQRGAHALASGHRGSLVLLDGFQQAEQYRAALTDHAAALKLVVLGMGMPKQEVVAQYLKHADIGPALIVCGGAIIDFAAGRVARAPGWIRRVGLEWLYRLLQEPRRLFRRYVIGIPIFLGCAALNRLRPRGGVR